MSCIKRSKVCLSGTNFSFPDVLQSNVTAENFSERRSSDGSVNISVYQTFIAPSVTRTRAVFYVAVVESTTQPVGGTWKRAPQSRVCSFTRPSTWRTARESRGRSTGSSRPSVSRRNTTQTASTMYGDLIKPCTVKRF